MGKKSRHESVVYFVWSEAEEMVKIGTTVDIEQRLRQFQTHTPHEVELLGTIPGSHKKERAVHKVFAGDRFSKEWFTANKDDVLAYIEQENAQVVVNSHSDLEGAPKAEVVGDIIGAVCCNECGAWKKLLAQKKDAQGRTDAVSGIIYVCLECSLRSAR